MTAETFQKLCEAVHAISEASRISVDQSFLDEWRKWARVFVSGVDYSKTALRAADSALMEADERVRAQPVLYRVAMAAALVATGVAHAADKDDAAAREKVVAATNLVGGIGLNRPDS